MIILKKQFGESSIVFQIVRLLVELSQYVPYRGQGEPFTAWAKMLLTEFAWLRFEELSYILKKGASGKWGKDGKIYGEITYSFITEWIYIYDETERQPHFVNENIKKQGENKQNMKQWQVDLKPIIETIGKRIEIEKKELIEKFPNTDSNSFDEKQLALFQAFGSEWSDSQLRSAFESAKISLHQKTEKAIQSEINSRIK